MMSAAEQIKILIVDDRPENLMALASVLDDPGFDVFEVPSGNEALALVLKYDFAVVVLDVQMPEMDGFETAELMRGFEKTKHIPIIFVTATSMAPKYVFKGYETGAVDYLFKPIDTYILKSQVKVFCDLYRQRRQVMQLQSDLAARVKDLEDALSQVKQLEGLVPICSYCKKFVEIETTGSKLKFTSPNIQGCSSATASVPTVMMNL
ncbi:MAG: response regulator [Candidatus Poribacteria bacterium]|nr:response regulator [Candidatus Poribacteria bacterium]